MLKINLKDIATDLIQEAILQEGTVKNSEAIRYIAQGILNAVAYEIVTMWSLETLKDYTDEICDEENFIKTNRSSLDVLEHVQVNYSFTSGLGEKFSPKEKIFSLAKTSDFIEFINHLNLEVFIDPAPESTTIGGFVIWLVKEEDGYYPIEINLQHNSAYVNAKQSPICLKPSISTFKDFLQAVFLDVIVHEFQHVYDYWRSKNKIGVSKAFVNSKSATYGKRMHIFSGTNFESEEAKKKEEDKIMGLYLDLPHEIWARVQQVLQNSIYYNPDAIIAYYFMESTTSKKKYAIQQFLDQVYEPTYSGEVYGNRSAQIPTRLKKRLIKIFTQFINLRFEELLKKSKTNPKLRKKIDQARKKKERKLG
jgi:hypothetical protein